MFERVSIRASDHSSSERFYRMVLEALGIEPSNAREGVLRWDDFVLLGADGEQRATRHLHIAFVAPSREHVDAFWRAGVDAGYFEDGPPGERPQYKPDYYGAFLLDPDGNSVEAVHHGDARRGGHIDHLWIGVGDLAAAEAFYNLIAPHTGLREGRRWEHGVQFRGAWATFSLVQDGRPVTNGLQMAFAAPDRETVDSFRRAAASGGYSEGQAAGERQRASGMSGDYAASVLDPNGTVVESVLL